LIESFISVCDAVRLSRPGISPPSSPMKKKLVTVNPAETLRILIAEDNKINQKVLLKILERLNFKNVDVVDDGQQACQREFCVPYDIILMDVQMPIMNGIDACEEILGRASNHPKPKVIFITAHVSDAYEAACRAVGGADFLPKPVNVSDVDDCLRRNMPLLPAFPPPVQVVSADVSAEETTAPQRIDQPSAGATSVEEITAQQRIDQPPEAAISVEKTTALQRIDQPPEPATSVEETTAPRTIARPPEAATSVDRTADPQSNPTPVESDGGIPAMPRILIAEDNKINQKVLCKILQKLEYTDVDVVDDGKQACDKEFLQPYDLILMDIQMPVMNGIEACKVILGRSTTHPKPKIVFVTAHVSDEFESECDNAGGVDFLTKPVNIKTIQNCLRRHIAVVPVAEPVNAAPPSSRQAAITVPELLAPPATPPVRASGTPVIEKPEESPPAASLRILIAEDNKINQKVLMRILDRLGYKNVDVVDDGKQACDRELEKEYDIILMDIQMPVMDGIEACREILGRPSRHAKSPKVIFVTAHVSDAFAAECDAAGGVDFIAKPVNLADIDKCLRRHTHSAAAPSE
jgi:CheY-like chemotaxis protein